MPRIAVVDDQPDMRQQLCSMIDQYSRENNCMLEVTAFSDGAQIITNYCKGFDIIFLDIETPELGGMDAAERIRTVDPDVVLVFVTNMAQYAIRGYEVDALDFVLKPVNTSSAPSWPALCSGCSAAKAGRLHYRPLGACSC